MSFHFSPRIVTDGLIFYIDAGNHRSYNNGQYWNDISKNNLITDVIGGTFSPENGGSILLDGVDDFVRLQNVPQIQFTNKSEVTIDAWIMANSFSGVGSRFIYAQFYSGGNTSCGIYIKTSGEFNFGYRDNVQNNSGSIKAVSSNTILSTGKIYNLVATFKANVITKLYINGVLDNSSVQNNNIASVSPDSIRVGRLFNPTADFFNGKIYIVRNYDRALTEEEVMRNFVATKSRFDL